jgi:hypothetical protein
MADIDKIYAVRNKLTNKFVLCNSRVAWAKAVNAKVSWALCHVGYNDRRSAFDKQSEYEIVEITAENL